MRRAVLTVKRDDGSPLTLSMDEARRTHDAYDREVLRQAVEEAPTVGRCAGAKGGCRACLGASRSRSPNS